MEKLALLLLACFCSVVGAFILPYIRPDLFSLPVSFLVSLVYFLLLGWFVSVIGDRFIPTTGFKDWKRNSLVQIGFFLLFILVGAIFGCVSGVVWWGLGGHEIHAFWEAIHIGAILGGVTVFFIFTGSAALHNN